MSMSSMMISPSSRVFSLFFVTTNYVAALRWILIQDHQEKSILETGKTIQMPCQFLLRYKDLCIFIAIHDVLVR